MADCAPVFGGHLVTDAPEPHAHLLVHPPLVLQAGVDDEDEAVGPVVASQRGGHDGPQAQPAGEDEQPVRVELGGEVTLEWEQRRCRRHPDLASCLPVLSLVTVLLLLL